MPHIQKPTPQKRKDATAQDAVQRTLAHIEAQARHPTAGVTYETLLAVPDLPVDALAGLGTLHRLDDGADALPSLLLEDRRGQAQMEVCPFGPLVLLTSDGEMDTDPPAQALMDAGLWPLFPGDMAGAGRWHGTPVARWLFPRRLADALALFDALQTSLQNSFSGRG